MSRTLRRPREERAASRRPDLREAFQRLGPENAPSFSIVSVVFNKENEIAHFLGSFFRQTYPGEIEIILVDDRAEDGSLERVRRFLDETAPADGTTRLPDVHILRNDANLGNCRSRNLGIARAKGDIIVVIDADCVVNKDFLKAHAVGHMTRDCDVVVGPYNIETRGNDPLSVLTAYEAAPARALRECELQDAVNPGSFLNCITRNFSIRRSSIEEELFDPLFSYSRDPRSGFGWEDVEMGYRLYKRGARIKFTDQAFSIHISHASSIDESAKPYRSLLNFRRLFDKHPELLFAARRWVLDTYQRICAWIDGNGLAPNDDRRQLDNRFQRFLPPPFMIRTKRRLRVLSYRWHCPHQYELYKLPHDFTLVTGAGTHFTNVWQYSQRPLRPNVRMLPRNAVKPSEYDLAILHFDENVLAPENTNGIIGNDWGANFTWFVKKMKMPMAAICHGTPQFEGQYTTEPIENIRVIERERVRLVDFLKGVPVVCNSHQAQREWRFADSRVIWHGFDPTEYPPALYEKGILTPGKMMKERPHYRGYFIYRQVFEDFPGQHAPSSLSVPEPDAFYGRETNEYAAAKYANYVNSIRRYSIYFNPTLRSPMPRSRGEAMMCGLVNVSMNNHDVELYIKNGVNGFYSNDPAELREYLLYLLENPDQCRRIGGEGRKLAMDLFNHDRYLKAWDDLISEIV